MEKQKALEFKVGLFLFIGFAVVGAMVAKFGQIGQGFQDFYDLTVHFDNAGGIVKRSDVQLFGTRIGYVEGSPSVLSNMSGVQIHLKIQKGTRIPKHTKFQIGSSGLLGDKFVEVVPELDFNPDKFDANDPAQVWPDGSVIQGTEQMGLAELQQKGVEVLDELKARASELQTTIDKVNNGILTDENASNLKATFANLKQTSESFTSASAKLNGVMDNINKTVTDASGVIQSAKSTVDSVQKSTGDLNAAMADARKLIAGGQELITKATKGEGVIGTLVSDKQMAENLRALVANLRERGVIFYKDAERGNEPQHSGGSSRAPRR